MANSMDNLVGGEFAAARYHVVAQDANGNWCDLSSNLPNSVIAMQVFDDLKAANPGTRLRLVATTVMNEYRGDLIAAAAA